jgi:PAS domain S-box-containing protein
VCQHPRPDIKQQVLRTVDAAKGAAKLMNHFTQSPGECLVVTDGERRVTWVNEAFSLMCGYSLQELKGKSPGRLLGGSMTDPTSSQRIREALNSAQLITEEILNYRKSGRPYWVRLTICPIVNTANKVCGFIALGRENPSRALPARYPAL